VVHSVGRKSGIRFFAISGAQKGKAQIGVNRAAQMIARERELFMCEATATPTSIPAGDKTIFGHPRGLYILFFTEMWERFSYYGMRSLLVLYLTQHFLFSDERSAVMYGAYTALVYVMTIIGGSLADKYLGQRKAVTYGAILLVMGHGLMAFEGGGSTEYLVANGTEIEVHDEGRGGNRQLFVEVDGSLRRMVFKNVNYALIDGRGENGGVQRVVPIDGDGNGDYQIDKQSRSMFQNICDVIGLGCKGPDPKTTLKFSDGMEYELIDVTEDDEEYTAVVINGQKYKFEEKTDSNIQFLETDDRQKEPTAAVYETILDGAYNTRVVQEPLFVNILYLALALIIAGVGFLKANISTIVGALYGLGDTRRDSGFTIFYMGINLGSLLSTLTVGIIGIVWGWNWGFGLAGVGMLAGLLTFLVFQPWLEGRADPPSMEKLKEKVFGPINVEWACYLTGVGIIIFAMLTVMNSHLVKEWFVGMVGIFVFLFLVGYAITKLAGQERDRMLAAIYFILAQIPFWALFEQAGSSLTLFTARMVDRTVFGWEVPTPVFQSLNAGFIVMFAPIFAWMWIAMAKRKIEPSAPVKFAFGVFLAGLGFLSLVGGIAASGTGLIAVYFIFLIYWIHTMGELMLSPVGLSQVTKLAPARAVGMSMGAWFLYSGLSNYLAGVIARGTGAETIGGQLTDVVAAKATYVTVYTNVAYVAMGIGVFMLLISPIIKKLMHLDTLKGDPAHALAGEAQLGQPGAGGIHPPEKAGA
jgi:proton-dependent oligopeptide transporter, POT family